MARVGTAPGTTTLQLPDGSAIAVADWIDDKLFAACEWTTGDITPLELFTVGRSQAVPGGTRIQTAVDTNIPRNGDSGLPKDWEMLVYSWGIGFTRATRGTPVTLGGFSDPVTLNTAFQIDRVMSFSYQYNGKEYTQGTPQDYPLGHGFSVFSTNAAFELANNGVPSPRDKLSLVLPVRLRENLSFKAVFTPQIALTIAQAASDGGAVLDSVDMKVYKYGLIKRTVV